MISEHKIEKFLAKELSSSLKEVFIIQDNVGNYELFNKYKIEPQNNGLYKVIPYTYTEERIFSSLKNAFTWCIFNKLNKFTESKRIEKLDHMLDALEITIQQQKKLLAKYKDPDIKSIYRAKLHESKVRKNIMLKEIKTYINISRHWQYKKFLEKQPR